MHHPLMSNGSHGGQLEKKILPVIGSFINLLRKTGASPQDIQTNNTLLM
jgi:hypothetical protein